MRELKQEVNTERLRHAEQSVQGHELRDTYTRHDPTRMGRGQGLAMMRVLHTSKSTNQREPTGFTPSTINSLSGQQVQCNLAHSETSAMEMMLIHLFTMNIKLTGSFSITFLDI